MEHNLARYAKYYSCGSIKIIGISKFTRKFDHNKRDFLDIGKHVLETSYTLNLGLLLKITPKLKIYLWQKLKPEKTQNLNRTTTEKQVGFSIPKVGTTIVVIDNHMVVIQV